MTPPGMAGREVDCSVRLPNGIGNSIARSGWAALERLPRRVLATVASVPRTTPIPLARVG